MKNVIGLDIGGTKICGIVFDGKKAIKVLTMPTPKSLLSFTSSLKKMVETLSMGQKIEGLGIGMAGIVDQGKAQVVNSPNLKFIKNLDVGQMFPAIRKIKIDNDANCFTRAEAKLGQGKGLKTFIGLTLGTGIGGGMSALGEIYLGAHGSAGEAGHMMLDLDQTIENHFQKARDNSSYKQMAKVVGVLLANIYNLLDPEAVILGGSVAVKSHERFLPQAAEYAQKHLLNQNIKMRILVSGLENAGAIGAALQLTK